MSTLGYILLSVSVVSLISLVGVITLTLRQQTLDRLTSAMIAFAAGTMLGAAFLDFIPEALHEVRNGHVFILAGIVAFFLIERAIHWHHCTEDHCIAPVGYLNLIGDAVHNFADGVIIAAAFLSSPHLGLVATVAIAMHELPQELGDFAVLLHSGFSPRRAIWLNFLTACTAIAGGLAGYLFLQATQGLVPYVLGLATGGLIYIAVADLMPELQKERRLGRIITHTASLLLGILIILGFLYVAPHSHVGHDPDEAAAAAVDPGPGHEHHGREAPAPRPEPEGLVRPGAGPREGRNHPQGRVSNHGEVPDNRHGRVYSLRHLPGDLPGGLPG